MGRSGQSRRELLAGLGAAGIGVAGLGVGAARPAAASEGGEGPISNPGPAPAGEFAIAAAPTTPGTSYFNIAGVSLTSGTNVNLYSSTVGELFSTNSAFFTTNLALPAGAVVTEMAVYFIKDAAQDILLRLIRSDGSAINMFQDFLTVSTSSSPVSATVQTIDADVASSPLAVSDPAGAAMFLVVNMPASAQVSLRGVRIGYVTPQRSFVPLTPGRVYDSRWPIFSSAKIVSGEARIVSVRDRRRIEPDDGAVDIADFVPPGATAISFNLTVVDTDAQGFLAVTPGDAAAYAAASINWFGPGQILNNGTVATIDAGRHVKVFAGGGGNADFIIDVTGYYI